MCKKNVEGMEMLTMDMVLLLKMRDGYFMNHPSFHKFPFQCIAKEGTPIDCLRVWRSWIIHTVVSNTIVTRIRTVGANICVAFMDTISIAGMKQEKLVETRLLGKLRWRKASIH